MGAKTGENAAVDGVNCVNKFHVQWTEEAAEANPSCLPGGGELLAGGVEDWTGQLTAYGGEPAKLPGETFTFTGGDDESGVTGPAIVGRLDVFWPVGEGKLLYHLMQFDGNGELEFGAHTASDAGTPNPQESAGLKFSLGATNFSIFSGQLTILCLNAQRNDTDTNGYVERARGNFRAFFTMDCYFDDTADLPTRKSFHAAKLYVDGTRYWQIDYARILQVKPQWSRSDEQGRAVYDTCRVVGRWSAFNGSSQGTITAPGGTILWPVGS